MTELSRPGKPHWRSKPSFIITSVAVGLFTDLFIYGIAVPVIPFLLSDNLSIPESQIQSCTSGLLAAYSGTSVVFSIPSGWIIDRIGSRQPSFVIGLVLLAASTTLLAFGHSMAALLAARVLQGMSSAIVWTAGLAMLQGAVGSGKLGQVIGTVFSIIIIGALVAPVLGGTLYDKAGIVGVFGVSAIVLLADLIMRLLVIDGSTVAKPGAIDTQVPRDQAQESEPLLPNHNAEGYQINRSDNCLVRGLPIVYCFREPRLLVALFLSFVQTVIMGFFDATVPTEAQYLFKFSSLQAGLLFIALFLPYLALGPVAGLAVDKHGTRVVATVGYLFLTPSLMLLGLPAQKSILLGEYGVLVFCAVLVLNGIGLAIIGAPSLVEASEVIQKYHEANPGFFGEHGPYAQLYGLNTLFLFAGLAIGPLLGGWLRIQFGYGTTAISFGVLSGLTSILAFFAMGQRRT